jgi:chaperonin GroEL (HSP60 family)
VSDLAAHYLMKADIAAIRRVRKTDNNRIARACGATIVSRPGALAGSLGLQDMPWADTQAGSLPAPVVSGSPCCPLSHNPLYICRQAGRRLPLVGLTATCINPTPTADEIRETDIGTGAGLFEVRKIGDEFYAFIVDCKVSTEYGTQAPAQMCMAGRGVSPTNALLGDAGKERQPSPFASPCLGVTAPCFAAAPPMTINQAAGCACLPAQDPKACSIVLRGASKDVLNEVERNLHDAMGVARNVCIGGCPRGEHGAWFGAWLAYGQ